MRILIRLKGGLGNQLFQLSHAYKMEQVFPMASIMIDTGWYYRNRASESARINGLDQQIIRIRFSRLPKVFWSQKLGLARLENIETGPLGQCLENAGLRLESGYWQSWQSVLSVRPWIEEVLTQESFRRLSVGKYRWPYVAVHIRGGDYAELPHVRDFHGLTDAAHQVELALQMAEELEVDSVRIFTDTPSRLEPKIRSLKNVQVSQADDPWQALFGMAGGRGLVMSNSTLSWWSAVYAGWGSAEPFSVLMPTPWFKKASDRDTEMLVPGWRTYRRRIID